MLLKSRSAELCVALILALLGLAGRSVCLASPDGGSGRDTGFARDGGHSDQPLHDMRSPSPSVPVVHGSVDGGTSSGFAPDNAKSGTTTPQLPELFVVRGEQDVFSTSHRYMRTDEDLLIHITQKTTKGIRIHRVGLAFSDGKVNQGLSLLDLTPFRSLDANQTMLRVNLQQAHHIQRLQNLQTELWKWDYALVWNQPADIQIQYSLDGDKQTELREVVISTAIVNRARGLFWGIVGLALSIGITYLIGRAVRESHASENPASQSSPWVDLLAVTLSPGNRYSLSALQVLIWTHLTAFCISYVWTMTGLVVQLTPQMLALLGIGGFTAVFSRFFVSGGTHIPLSYIRLIQEKRTPQLRDLLTSRDDNASIFKFQMLVFTVLSASVVTWEVLRTYSFPDLPQELVTLMGISNTTYLLGSIAGTSAEKSLWKDISKSMTDIKACIDAHNTALKAPLEPGSSSGDVNPVTPPIAIPWSVNWVVTEYIRIKRLQQEQKDVRSQPEPNVPTVLGEDLIQLLEQFQSQLERMFL